MAMNLQSAFVIISAFQFSSVLSACFAPIGDNPSQYCPAAKFGFCPSVLINPSRCNCSSNADCKGNRLCCISDEGRFCTDPYSSKRGHRCPKNVMALSQQTQWKCYTDTNCGRNNDLKCCLDEGECTSYCVQGISSCYNIGNKSEINCPDPGTLINTTGQGCTFSDECPRNQLCCQSKQGGGLCSDPISYRIGTCPAPENIPMFGPLCTADEDCAQTGHKCCRFDDCTYRCVQPARIPFTRKLSKRSIEETTANVSTLNSCKPKIRICPSVLSERSRNCKTDSDCGDDQICCFDFVNGNKVCHRPYLSKPGRCPTEAAVPRGDRSCWMDVSCPGDQKCCGMAGCGSYACVEAV